MSTFTVQGTILFLWTINVESKYNFSHGYPSTLLNNSSDGCDVEGSVTEAEVYSKPTLVNKTCSDKKLYEEISNPATSVTPTNVSTTKVPEYLMYSSPQYPIISIPDTPVTPTNISTITVPDKRAEVFSDLTTADNAHGQGEETTLKSALNNTGHGMKLRRSTKYQQIDETPLEGLQICVDKCYSDYYRAKYRLKMCKPLKCNSKQKWCLRHCEFNLKNEISIPATAPKYPGMSIPATAPKYPEKSISATAPESLGMSMPSISPKSEGISNPATTPKSPGISIPDTANKYPGKSISATAPKSPGISMSSIYRKSAGISIPATAPKSPGISIPATASKYLGISTPATAPKYSRRSIPVTAPKYPREETSFKSAYNNTVCLKEDNINYWGNDINSIDSEGADDCANWCGVTQGCNFWSLVKHDNRCWLKTSNTGRRRDILVISGTRNCAAKVCEGQYHFSQEWKDGSLVNLPPDLNCHSFCETIEYCKAWSWTYENECRITSNLGLIVSRNGSVSGLKNACKPKYCVEWVKGGTAHMQGDRWTCIDGCNTCLCLENGQIAKTNKKCSKIRMENFDHINEDIMHRKRQTMEMGERSIGYIPQYIPRPTPLPKSSAKPSPALSVTPSPTPSTHPSGPCEDHWNDEETCQSLDCTFQRQWLGTTHCCKLQPGDLYCNTV